MCCFAYALPGQNNNKYTVEKRLYTYVDGLPGRVVKSTIQDSKGFLWLVTNNALCRFDGKNFEVFTHQTHGLYSNNISSVISDNNHGIIISYFNDRSRYTVLQEHFEVMDINTLRVSKLNEYYKNIPFKDEEISQVRPDEYHNVLFFLKPFFNIRIETFLKSKVWELDTKGQFSRQDERPTKTVKFSVQDKNSIAVIETYNPSMSLKDKSFFVINNETMMSNHEHLANVSYKDNTGGFFLTHVDSVKRRYYYMKDYSSIKEVNSSDADFPKFAFDARTQYFTNHMDYTGVVGIHNQSLFVYNNRKELITLIDSTDGEQIRKAKIQSVFRDKTGNYWLSSSEGVIKATIKQEKFQKLFTLTQIPFGLNNSTRGFYKYKDALLVASYDFIGVKKESSTHIIKSSYNFNFTESNNKLWVTGSNLETLDLESQKKERMTGQLFGEFWTVFPLNNNQLLLGCSNNIGVYTISDNQINRIDTGGFERPNITYKFFEYKTNILAVCSNGIYVISRQGKIIDCYNKDQKDVSKRVAAEEINDVYIDKDDLHWICTAFDGLYCWNRSTNTLEQFGIEHGFLSTTHYRIEEDEFNNLWISTEFGLAKFNKKTKRAKVYTEKDGISHNEFNRISSFKDKDRTLYFGGMNGVTSFNPKDFFEEEGMRDYPFVMNNLSIYNSQTNLMDDKTAEFNSQKKIVLNENAKNATLVVSLLDLEDRLHVYAYKIEGLDKEWNYIKEGSIKLNNLPYGSHTIQIKAQCLNGLWNKTEITIPLIVQMPFYKTWWFMCTCLVCLATITIFYIKQRGKKLQKENEKLEQTVERRTTELKESLAEQITLLQEVHHRVKNNLQFIAAMLKMQLNTIKDENNQKILKETSRRINAMSLVHEMLYNKDKLEYVSVKDYLSELVTKLKDLVYDTEQPVTFKLEVEDVKFNINNCVAIGMITSEIISNSIKYAFSGIQDPTVNIQLSQLKNEQCIQYSINDNGNGLAMAEKKNGLGLRLIDIFSRQMEADYEVINDNGVKYIFKIPYEINEK